MQSILTEEVFGLCTDLLLQAVCSLDLFAFLRCGEFTSPSSKFDHTKGLSFSDVTITYEGRSAIKLILNLKSSKCDPLRKGCTILLFPTGAQLCPVRNMLNFIKAQAPFVLDPCSRTTFHDKWQGTPHTRNIRGQHIQKLLSRLGLTPSSLSWPLSTNIGAATSAAERKTFLTTLSKSWPGGPMTVANDTSVGCGASWLSGSALTYKREIAGSIPGCAEYAPTLCS